MFELIEKYMMKSREERRSHLNLDQPCIKIGGCSSVAYKGLLAHSLKTTIPTRQQIFLCHACNDAGCSNIQHLYWGTPKDNHLDQVLAGTFKAFPRSKEKRIEMGKQLGTKFGKINGGRNILTEKEIKEIKIKLDSIPKKYGWIAKASRLLGVSHTQIRRYIKMIDNRLEI